MGGGAASEARSAREADVVFAVADADRRLRRVRLAQELRRPRIGPDFVRTADGRGWELRLPRPAVDRLEYRLELTHADGRVELVCDDANPLRAPGPFGDKSVLELPGYRAPSWLHVDAPRGSARTVRVTSRALAATLSVTVWSPPGARPGRALPLLVVHDGPEYAKYSELLRYLAVGCAGGDIPAVRATLVPPAERDRDYSASARYARALAREILPRLEPIAPTAGGRSSRAAVGTSLGALAALHAHRAYPDLFGGLFLQSGSFFRQRYDSHERSFPRFRRISRFVGAVLAAPGFDAPVPVRMTCGAVEENLANNRVVATALARQGYDVRLGVVRDAHNWIAWRDALDPHLGELLRRLWG